MKIGLITYHSAYNFGSVLQALATQIVVEKLGHEVTIINYRPKSQKQFYSVVNTHNGIKRFIKSVLRLTNLPALRLRAKRYEEFMQKHLNTTNEFSEPEEVACFSNSFDVYISGSDQIWNKNSNELKNVSWKFMEPYLLSFTERKKISYASSINDMKVDEAKHIVRQIKRFKHISCREKRACEQLENLIGAKIPNVLDPTLLIHGSEWLSIVPKERVIQGKYVLYYSLRGISDVNEDLSILLRKYDRIAVIAPLSPVRYSKKIINMDNAGPYEFIRLIRDADCIITTSYHGTLFSINLHKPFFSIRGKSKNSNIRFEDILTKTGLMRRLIDSTADVTDEIIDYNDVEDRLEKYREFSNNYLNESIED